MQLRCIYSVLLMVGSAIPLVAAGPPYLVTYSHQMEEPGNLEVAANQVVGNPQGGNRTLAPHKRNAYHMSRSFTVTRNVLAIAVLALFLSSGALWAHHSPTAVFDMGKPVTVKGTLTKIDWFNPHISMYIDVKAADGSTETWKFESNPPSWFKSVGMTRADFAKVLGQTITVGGVPARDGSHYGYMFNFVFPDGNSIELKAKELK
jgi:hypothetical protein